MYVCMYVPSHSTVQKVNEVCKSVGCSVFHRLLLWWRLTLTFSRPRDRHRRKSTKCNTRNTYMYIHVHTYIIIHVCTCMYYTIRHTVFHKYMHCTNRNAYIIQWLCNHIQWLCNHIQWLCNHIKRLWNHHLYWVNLLSANKPVSLSAKDLHMKLLCPEAVNFKSATGNCSKATSDLLYLYRTSSISVTSALVESS